MISYAYASRIRRLAEDRRERWLFLYAAALFRALGMPAASQRCVDRAPEEKTITKSAYRRIRRKWAKGKLP